MRITSIRLKNFKRFTDLSVKNIPDTAKLVVIVGPNGSGKSSIFDALLHWYKINNGYGYYDDKLYYIKNQISDFDWYKNAEVTVASGQAPHKGCLYVRTAYRNDPDFTVGGITRPAAPSETVSIGRIIENDQTVSQNFQRLIYDTMAGVYSNNNDEKTVKALREELIGAIRISMKEVFGDLLLNNISDPLGSGAFFFEKGSAKSYHYKNLSGGEKAAFDLILDLHVKKKYFPDAVYCIDEIETHLHTRVQGSLLKELVKIVPEGSQLWTTTHSLGILRAAQELSLRDPGSVCVIDFDGEDPDVPQEIYPSNLGRVSWEKMLSLALDNLSNRVAPKTVIVCEGSSIGNRRKDFDAEIYNRIISTPITDVLFVSGGSSGQLNASGVSITQALSSILPNSKVLSLCDRDDKSDFEISEFELNGNLVLSRRNLESFLFDNEVIEKLLMRENKIHLLEDVLNMKELSIEESVDRGNASDDIKSAAGRIYIGLKKILDLKRCGNNTDTFMRDTLAPLIEPPMRVYEEIKSSIIDRIE